jgi:glyoxylase-like metal-dependent hydrolase (beta-lactamase superfamily II)
MKTHAPHFLSILALALAACSGPAKPDTTKPTDGTADVKPPAPRSHAFKIGALDAYAVQDGEMSLPNDGSILAIGHAPQESGDLLAAAGLPKDPITLSIQCLAVKVGENVLLFDTGTGGGIPGTGALLASLESAGAGAGLVTDVFVSHAHPDHIGGLVGTDGALAFPRAKVHMSAPEWDAMQANADLAATVEKIKGVVVPFEPGAQILPEVRAVDTRGHTPGHSSYEIGTGSDTVFYLGDLAHHSVISVQRAEWPIQFDGDKPAAQAMREKTLGELAASNKRVFAVHFPFPGIGHVVNRDMTWAWTAE